MRSVIVLEARVQALVTKRLVAVTVTRQLGQRLRNSFGYLICFFGLAEKMARVERRPKLFRLLGGLESRYSWLHRRRCRYRVITGDQFRRRCRVFVRAHSENDGNANA